MTSYTHSLLFSPFPYFVGLHCIDAAPEDFQSLPELLGARKRLALRGMEPRQPGREDNEGPDFHVGRPARDLEAVILGEEERLDALPSGAKLFLDVVQMITCGAETRMMSAVPSPSRRISPSPAPPFRRTVGQDTAAPPQEQFRSARSAGCSV